MRGVFLMIGTLAILAVVAVLVAVLLVVLATIVAFQNTNVVDTRLLFGTLSMPHTLLVALVFATGMLSGAILCRHWAHWRQR